MTISEGINFAQAVRVPSYGAKRSLANDRHITFIVAKTICFVYDICGGRKLVENVICGRGRLELLKKPSYNCSKNHHMIFERSLKRLAEGHNKRTCLPIQGRSQPGAKPFPGGEASP